jgi:fido (protein-threonine AMPylation protein)
LAAGTINAVATALDPRPIHARMFGGMTDPGDEYFTGHYRGEDFPNLRYYNVMVQGYPEVGVHFTQVEQAMKSFYQGLSDAFSQNSGGSSTDPKVLFQRIGSACAALAEFLRVHPFADGNGHAGRYIVWAFLVRFGIYPRSWPLNQSLPAPYGDLLSRFRAGDRAPLIQYVVNYALRAKMPVKAHK